MRVLWVTGNNPQQAATGGAAHEWELLRFLAERHSIHVITARQPLDPEETSSLTELGVTIEGVTSRQRTHPTSRLGVAAAMAVASPTMVLWLQRHRIVALRTAIARALADEPYDLVHITHGEFAPVLSASSAPTALLLFDSYSRHIERLLAHEPVARRRLQRRVELLRTRRFEKRWYRRATGVAAVSSVDAEQLGTLSGRRVDVLPNPIAAEYFDAPRVGRQPDLAAFVGTIAYVPNVDAVEWLTSEIWPLVLEEHPGARLVVAGRTDGDTVTVPKVRALVERAGGSIEPDVADIRDVYWRAGLVVAPVRLGSGLRNKVIHAMACGAPVVATPEAIEGVPARHQEHLLVGTDARSLADAISASFSDQAATAARVERAQELARTFESSLINERFDQWWNETAAAGRRRAPTGTPRWWPRRTATT